MSVCHVRAKSLNHGKKSRTAEGQKKRKSRGIGYLPSSTAKERSHFRRTRKLGHLRGSNPNDHQVPSVDSRVHPAVLKIPNGFRFAVANATTLAGRGPILVCKVLGTFSVAI